jgi:membrane-bound lytic murein transglycosylase C
MTRWAFAVVLFAMSGSLASAQAPFDDLFEQQESAFDDLVRGEESRHDALVLAEEKAFERFRAEVETKWDVFEASTRKDWVEYWDDHDAKSVVDFERGEARVEVLVPRADIQADPEIATKRLAEAVEHLVADRGTTLDYDVGDQRPQPLADEPVLDRLLVNAVGETVTPQNARAFSRELVESEGVVQTEVESEDGVHRIKISVTAALVPNHLRVLAREYLPLVRAMSREYHIDPRLVFAVIHTESYFNPKARSHANAYGLMQLVPASGGREAYRYVYDEDRIVTPNYLFAPENNIRLGTAYLELLLSREFARVSNPDSRHYCAISAYNTGAGNVSRALTGSKELSPAIDRLNSMSSPDVLKTLKRDLPYEETRRYLHKVLDRIKLYEEWGA